VDHADVTAETTKREPQSPFEMFPQFFGNPQAAPTDLQSHFMLLSQNDQ
jgi:hypothetical protein